MINRAFVPVLALLCVISFIPPAAAQTKDLRFPDSLVISANALQSATQTARQTPSGVSPQASPAPKVPLTVDEALKMALEHNLDIAVQRFNQETYDPTLAALRAVYNPTVTSTIVSQSATNPGNSTLNGVVAGQGINTGTQNFNAGISQGIKWGGGSFTAALNNTRATTSSPTSLFNPLYTPNWSATYTQPALRNFRIDATRQTLLVTKLNQEITDVQLQATIANTQANVQNAYWDYVFALQSVDVAQQSLSLAEELVRNNQSKVEIGTLAPIDVVQSQTQAAAARNVLITAQGSVRTAEIALKRLIVSGTNDPLWTSTIDPTDRPGFNPAPIDINAAIQRAQASRSDVVAAKKDLAINDVNLKFLNDQTLPQADIVGRYGLVGQGGTQFLSTGTGITRVVTGTVPGGYSDALSALLHGSYPTWALTLNFAYPLGMSAARAAVARAKVQQNQIDAQLRQIDLAVASDVSNAGVGVQNAVERVQAAVVARDLAQQQLDAENSKFAVGMSTNFLIVQAQRDLATGQNNLLQAILAYRRALVEFDRVQQTGNGGTITLIGR